MSINKKFIGRQLGGAPAITTQEIVAALREWADDEMPALRAMLLRVAAERLATFEYQQELRTLAAAKKG